MTTSQNFQVLTFVFAFYFITPNYLPAQVLCINCYHQNERIIAEGENLILNGGFENGCNEEEWFCPNATQYACDLSNWKCTGGGTETYARCVSSNPQFLIIEGTKAAYFGNLYCVACTDSPYDTTCLYYDHCEYFGIPDGFPLNDPEYGGTEGVSLEQVVYGLIPGEIYQLEFWTGGEYYWFFEMPGLFAVDIGLGKIYLRNPLTPPIDGIGTRYLIGFQAWSDSTTIRFTNWGHFTPSATELVLDDVRLLTSDESNNPCILATEENNAKERISIVPNPFQNTASLEITNSEFQHGQLLIFNSTGNLVQKTTVSQSSTIIERNSLPSGIYFYQLILDSQKGYTGRFVID